MFNPRTLVSISICLLFISGTGYCLDSVKRKETGNSLKSEKGKEIGNFNTGEETGIYYPVGKFIAEMIKDKIQGVTLDVKNSKGSDDNIDSLYNDKCTLALVQNDLLYKCKKEKDKRLEDVRGLLSLYPEYIQIVIRSDNNKIKNLQDLTTAKVSFGSKSSGTYKSAEIILKAADLKIDNSNIVEGLGPKESIDKVLDKEDGKIDVAILTRGSLVVNESEYRGKIKLLSLDRETVMNIVKEYPYYGYKRVDVQGSNVKPLVLYTRAVLVSKNLNADHALMIVELLDKQRNELIKKIEAEDQYSIDFFKGNSIAKKISIPFHDSAEKYFIKKGYMYSMKIYLIIFVCIFLMFILYRLRRQFDWKLDAYVITRPRAEKALRYFDLAMSNKIMFIVWCIAFIFSLDMLIIRYVEMKSLLPSPFDMLSFGETLLWLLVYASTGYTQDIFPISVSGQVFSIIIPSVGIGAIIFAIISFANNSFRLRELEKKGLIINAVKDHIVICGWNNRVPGIISDLTGKHVPQKRKVVLVANLDCEYPIVDYGFNKNLVSYCKGEPTSYEVLQKAYVDKADKVIIMADEKNVNANYSEGVLTSLIVESLYKQRSEEEGIYSEIVYKKDKDLFYNTNVNRLVSVEAIREKFVAAASENAGVTKLLLNLLEHKEWNALYSILVKELKPPLEEQIRGKSFIEIQRILRKQSVLLFAIYRSNNIKHSILDIDFREDSPYIVNPNTEEEKGHKVDLDDRLVFISRRFDDIHRGI